MNKQLLFIEQAVIKRLLEQEQHEPASIQPDSIIYVDMDGVVVDFHTPMIAEINSILDDGLPDFFQGSKTSRRALRKIKKQMGEEYRIGAKIDLHNPLIRELTFSIIKRKPYDYFVNLGQMKDGVEMLWPYVTSLPYRIEMLTASVQGLDPEKKTAEDAKKDWVATHLDPQPASVNVVMGAARKIPYAISNGVPNVLIDDRSDTIAKWNEAGGIGILHTTGNSASTIQRLKDVVVQVQEAAKRKPRKKGQKRKSSKHSDLYTDEDPKGTIHGLGFKDAATARKGRAIINKARRKHAHKVQAALVMKQRAKVAKERTKDPEKKKNLNAAYKVWSEFLEKLKAKTKKMKKESVVINEDLSAIPSPSEWYQNALDYWGSKDSPGVNAVHDTLSAMENVPFASIPAGIMNAFIYHAKGQNQKALLSLGFSALGGAAAKYLTKAIKNPGSAQKFFANLGHAGRKLAGKIKGHDFTILLTNPDAAQKAIATAALITPAAGEAAEDQINKLLDMSKEVRTELQRSQKLHDEFRKTIPRFTMRTVPTHVPIPGKPGVRDYDNYRTLPIDEKKRKHPRYRPPRKDPKTGKYDNPCGKGFAPGAQSGVKTKIGPQSGRRVSNCEPIKKKKNEAVLEAVLNRLLKEQDDLTTPGDLIWKGYLGWSVPKDQVGDVTSVPEAMISNRIQRDGGEDKFHITIISPVEVRAIANKIRDEQGLSGGKSKKEAKRQLFLAAAELEGPDYTIGQVSSVSGEGDGSVGVKGQPSEAHYKPVMWQAAQRLRAKFGLPPKDLHVTIGIGENGDVHGIEKQ